MKKLIIFLSVMVFSLSLASCSDDGGASSKSTIEGTEPAAQVDIFFQAVKAKDAETIEGVYAGKDFQVLTSARPDSEDEYTEIYDIMEEKVLDFDYRFVDEIIQNDTATVEVEITTYEIGDAFSSLMAGFIAEAFKTTEDVSEEELEKIFLDSLSETLNDLDEKTFQDTVTLSLSLVNGLWVVDEIQEDDAFYDVITGGTGNFGEDLVNSLDF